MNDYTKPYYVPIGQGRMNLHTGIRGGYYLPALEERQVSPPGEEPKWAGRQWDYVKQLQSRTEWIEKKLYEQSKKKKKPKLKTLELDSNLNNHNNIEQH